MSWPPSACSSQRRPRSRRLEEDEAVRPKINLFYRWLEDWSALADPRVRTEPLDRLKYIPLPFDDPKSYVSLGLTVRERFELNDAPLFGIGPELARLLCRARACTRPHH